MGILSPLVQTELRPRKWFSFYLVLVFLSLREIKVQFYEVSMMMDSLVIRHT